MGYLVCGDAGRSQWIWRGSKQRCFRFRFVLIRTGSGIELDLRSLSGAVGLGPILSMLRRVWMHSSRNVSRLSWKYPITTVISVPRPGLLGVIDPVEVSTIPTIILIVGLTLSPRW